VSARKTNGRGVCVSVCARVRLEGLCESGASGVRESDGPVTRSGGSTLRTVEVQDCWKLSQGACRANRVCDRVVVSEGGMKSGRCVCVYVCVCVCVYVCVCVCVYVWRARA
jgi:hypothetical protein